MAITANSLVLPQSPIIYYANLSAVTACTTRGPTAIASALITPMFGTLLVPTTTNGVRIDKILVKCCGTTFTTANVAQTVIIWGSDGTTCYPVDELLTVAVTPSTIVASYQGQSIYNNWVLPATHSIYVSTSITTTAAGTAMAVAAFGALY